MVVVKLSLEKDFKPLACLGSRGLARYLGIIYPFTDKRIILFYLVSP